MKELQNSILKEQQTQKIEKRDSGQQLQTRNNEESEHLSQQDQQLQNGKIIVPKEKKIKKPSILKKKPNKSIFDPLSIGPILKKLYLVGDMIVLNEESVKNPQQSRQSFIMNSLHFSRITSVHANHQYMVMNLKRNQSNYLTQQYLVDRFRSFNDVQFKELADNLEDVFTEQKYMEQGILRLKQRMGNMEFYEKINKKKLHQKLMVETTLQNQFRDKKYVVLFYTEGMKGWSLDKIYISTAMLNYTGFKLSDLIDTYTRQKNLSLELMGTSAYQQIFVAGSKYIAQTLRKRRLENPDEYKFEIEVDEDCKISDLEIEMQSQIYRKRHNNEIEWEEKLKCPMTFCKPLPSASIFVFGEAESQPIAIFNQKAKKIELLKFESAPSTENEMKTIEARNQHCKIQIEE